MNKTFQHKHITGLTCKVIDLTNKGYKVLTSEILGKKVKEKTAFFDKIDFDKEKGVWKEI